jgi:hypothetical protein
MFIFNTQLLMIGIDNTFEFIVVVVSSIIGMLLFAAATQGYWLTRNRWWETVLLLGIVFLIFRPGFLYDRIEAPYEYLDGKKIFEVADKKKEGDSIEFVVAGETLEGTAREYTFTLPLAQGENGKERIANTGLQLDDLFGPMEVAMVLPGNNKQVEAIKNAGVDSGWIVKSVRVETDRLPKQIIFIPLTFLILLMAWMQLNRKKKLELAMDNPIDNMWVSIPKDKKE